MHLPVPPFYRPEFLFDYPASQAALARIRPGNPPVASRFEAYLNGIELANGFHELSDAQEQRRRFTGERPVHDRPPDPLLRPRDRPLPPPASSEDESQA